MANSTTASALNARIVADIEAAGELLFAQLGVVIYGHGRLVGGHIEPNEMPLTLMYHVNASGTGRQVGLMDGTLLQWPRGRFSADQAYVNAYVARQAIPLFFVNINRNSRIKCRDMVFPFDNQSGKADGFCVSAVGQGSLDVACMEFESCTLPCLPMMYQPYTAVDSANGAGLRCLGPSRADRRRGREGSGERRCSRADGWVRSPRSRSTATYEKAYR